MKVRSRFYSMKQRMKLVQISTHIHRILTRLSMLPYLSRYLGHKSPDETYYYYHLVEKAFDTIREKDTVSGKVIPEVVPYEE